MQHEIEDAVGAGRLQILGVNEAGSEGGNDGMCDGRSIPWLQDRPDVNVWQARWKPTNRDIVILDGEGRIRNIYNATDNDLATASNYAELKSLLMAAIAAEQ